MCKECIDIEEKIQEENKAKPHAFSLEILEKMQYAIDHLSDDGNWLNISVKQYSDTSVVIRNEWNRETVDLFKAGPMICSEHGSYFDWP